MSSTVLNLSFWSVYSVIEHSVSLSKLFSESLVAVSTIIVNLT